MKARLIAVGEGAPSWVAEGFAEYRKRLSYWMPLDLVEVAPGLRGKGRDPLRAMQDEGVRVLNAVPKGARIIMLDGGQDLAFLIGGPEGHAAEVRAAASESWALGPATLPHMLVRLIVAEQLYRAASILANHPYHRA